MTPQMELWIRVYAATVQGNLARGHASCGWNEERQVTEDNPFTIADMAVEDFNHAFRRTKKGWKHVGQVDE